MPGGFLLADDAAQSALDQFDQWEQDQRQKVLNAAQPIVQPVQQAVQTVQQTVDPAAQAALNQFDTWEQQARAAALAPPQPQAQPLPAPATIAPAPAAPQPTVSSSALDQFDQWEQQARANAMTGLSSAGQVISGAAQTATAPLSQPAQNIGAVADQAGKQLDNAVTSAASAATGAVMGTSQFGDTQLTAAESYAACGPAAAVRFAQMYGRNPTLREATDLARSVGWSEGQGMAGIGSEKALMDKLGVPTHQVGADWNAIANEAQTGNPVTLSTPGHYFFADGYDPNSGAFHVGRSGLDLKGGSEWMTPQQMESHMGRLQGALFADNPTVPSTGGQPQSQPAAQAQTQPPSSGIDASSPQAFARSFAPYAAYAAQKLGIDPGWVTAMAASESNYGKAPGNELFGVKGSGTAGSQTLATHEGEWGGTAQNAGFAAYNTPLDSVNAWVDLISKYYPGAYGAQDLATFVRGLKQGGYFTAAEPEYLAILQSINDRLGNTVTDALNAAGGTANAARQAASNAVNAGQQALGSAQTAASDALSQAVTQGANVARSAQDVLSQGQQLTTRLQQQGDQALQDLQAARDKADAQLNDYLQRSQTQRDQINAQIQQQRANNPALSSISDVYQRAADLVGQAPSPIGGTLGQNLETMQNLPNVPQQLEQLGQGVQAANTEALRQQQDQGPLSAGVNLAESLTGQQLPEGLRAGLTAGTTPPGAAVPDVSGPVSDFLKSSGIIPAARTIDLPFIGPTPLADIVGQAANFVVPLGAEERFAGGAASAAARAADRAAFLAEHGTTQFGWAQAIGSHVPQVRDAARTAVSGMGRWARASVDDIMRDLSGGPIGDLVRNEAGTLDVDKLRAISSEIKQQVTRMYHGTSAAFEAPAPGRFEEEGLYGPGYYLTSDPRVAGGAIARGGEPIPGAPRIFSSASQRGPNGELLPINPQTRRTGEVISQGYAGVAPKFTSEDIAQRQDAVTGLARILREEPLQPEGREYIQNMLDQAKARAAEVAGPNVRAVDVPQDMRLFDADGPVTSDVANSVADRLIQSGPWRNEALDSPEVASRVRDWATGTGDDLYRELVQETGSRGEANQILADVGFDGIQHEGGLRVPMTDENGQPIQHQVNVIFPESLDKIRNAISGRQGGQADPRMALRLAGGVGGVASQEYTMSDQDKQDPWGRFGRDVAAGVLGSAAPGTALALAQRGGPSYADIAGLRPAVSHLPSTGQTGAQLISALTKQNLLSGVKTHVTNILTQLAELARQPVSAAVGGREDEAITGLKTAAQALPDAFSNFARALTSGQTTMTGQTGKTAAYLPVMRLLSATDDFFRTIGWAMGAGMEGQRFLRENPGAVPSAVLSANRTAIDEAGQKMGRLSVFGEGKGIAAGFSDFKQRLLSSSSKKDQVMGLLWDALVPFSGVPDRIWNIGIKRTPGIGELGQLANAGFKFAKGDVRGAQQAVGDALQQSVVSAAILSNIANGNIRGPDDREHPNGIRLNGQWYDYSSWGPWVLPIAWPAAMWEAAQREGNKPNPDMVKAMGNSTLKVLANQSYAGDLIKTLSQVSEGSGMSALGNTALSYADRYLPASAALNQATALFDPILRDPANGGLQAVLERMQSKIPGLESQLPATPVMTSGKPQERASSGPGMLVGMQTRPVSQVESTINALERDGYKIGDPTKVPTSVSYHGSSIPLTEDEGRKIAVERGKRINEALADELKGVDVSKMSESDRADLARRINRLLARADDRNGAIWADMTSDKEIDDRMGRGKSIAGKLQPAGSR